jgi:hypothetical protein
MLSRHEILFEMNNSVQHLEARADYLVRSASKDYGYCRFEEVTWTHLSIS